VGGDRTGPVPAGPVPAGPVPNWQQLLDDPGRPLFTIGVVAELLAVDQQVIRRFEANGLLDCARPSGNQRRYSRDDIALLSYALTLAEEGHPYASVARIVQLEHELRKARGEQR
jgi:DNA-binding transcriptional MerR regulator